MRVSLLVIALCVSSSFLYAGQQIKGTITEIVDDNNRKAVLVDIDNNICKARMIASFAENHTMLCYSQRDNAGITDGPLLVQKNSGTFFSHDKMGKDIGIGAGLCAAGCLFVLVAGETTKQPAPDGFYATVGDKSLYGGPACFVGLLNGAGCLFLIKGIVEIFTPRHSRDYGSRNNEQMKHSGVEAVAHINTTPLPAETVTSSKSTEAIVTNGNFKVVNRIEKTVTIDNMYDLENWIKRYCLSI